MKVGGVQADKPGSLEPLVFPRGKESLVFIAKAVGDLNEFNAVCPEPDLSKHGRIGKEGWEPDPEAPAYLELMKTYRAQRWAYFFIKTLEPSNIEWDKVKLSDPRTWKFYEEELRANLSFTEYGHVVDLVEQANLMGTERLEVARQRFFQKQAALSAQLIPISGQATTPSGELALGQGSVPPA